MDGGNYPGDGGEEFEMDIEWADHSQYYPTVLGVEEAHATAAAAANAAAAAATAVTNAADEGSVASSKVRDAMAATGAGQYLVVQLPYKLSLGQSGTPLDGVDGGGGAGAVGVGGAAGAGAGRACLFAPAPRFVAVFSLMVCFHRSPTSNKKTRSHVLKLTRAISRAQAKIV